MLGRSGRNRSKRSSGGAQSRPMRRTFRSKAAHLGVAYGRQVGDAVSGRGLPFAGRPVPFHRSAQPLRDGNSWTVSQNSSRFFDVCQGVFHISRPGRPVGHLHIDLGEHPKVVQDLIQAGSDATGNVEDLTCGAICACGQQVGLNHIVDVGKVPGLLAVAVDGDPSAV